VKNSLGVPSLHPCLSLFALLLAAGCDGNSPAAADLAMAPNDLAMAADLTMPPPDLWVAHDLTPPLFEVHGWVKDFSSMAPVADAKVCQFGTQNCATSDAMGNFQLNGLPHKMNLMISYEKTGYLKDLIELYTLTATGGLDLSHYITKVSDAMLLANAAGDNLDPNRPGLIVAVTANNSGVAIAAAPSPGGRGPIYLGAMGIPDPNLKATGASGLAIFFNNTAGDYDVTLTPMNSDKCDKNFGWAGLNGSTTQAHLVDGYFTVVFPQCHP
jgi:hypothetical protein